MSRRKVSFLALVAVLAGLLPGCAVPPTGVPQAETAAAEEQAAAWRTHYLQLAQAGGGRVFVLDPGRSTVRIYVFRGGRAPGLGHNHVLSAPAFAGFVYLPGAAADGAKFDLEFRLDRLEVDNPQHRAAAGAGFAAPLPPGAATGTREHMLGEDNLQAARFPFVRIRSLRIAGEAPRFAAEVEVEMHGQKRPITLPLEITGLPDRLAVTGRFVLRQTDFGVAPYAVLGGLLAVQDEVVVDFDLVGAR